jgi:hypothetical protein
MANGTISLGTNEKLQGQIVWSSSSNGSISNSSNVTADLQIRKTSSTEDTKGTFSYELNVGEKNQTNTWYGSLSTGWVTIATLGNTVGHNNNGTGSVYISGKATGPTGTTLSGITVSGGEQVTLDTIPRYAAITKFKATTVTDKSVTLEISADVPIDHIQYSLNDGSFEDLPTDGTITGLDDDTTYSIKVKVRRTDSQLWTTSEAISVTTLKSKLMKIKLNGTWKEAISYLKINGTWKEAKPYIKVNGVWEEGV